MHGKVYVKSVSMTKYVFSLLSLQRKMLSMLYHDNGDNEAKAVTMRRKNASEQG